MNFELADFIIGIVFAAIGALISYLGLRHNQSKDDRNEGKQDGVMLTELGYIKANTDEIKNEQREQRKINTDVVERLVAVESSTKQAHHRLNQQDERINHILEGHHEQQHH